MKEIRIDNSKQSAVKSGKWKNPGSSFYYKILNSFTIADPNRSEEEPGRYDFDFRKVLQEAYLVAPVEKIKNSPYGITPYSQSGCKYPHHVIRNGKLVVSIPGIQAAYARAKQQGIYKGKVKEHIDRHYKEMGLTMSTMTESVDPIQDQIDLNFDFIQKYIESALGVKFVHDDVMMESVDDIVDKEQYIKETFDWMDEILYQSDEEYNASLVGSSLFEETDPLFDLPSTSDIEELDFEEKYSANEFITVNPNDGMEFRENTWNHFMKLINDSENKFGLARSNDHHLGLVESIDEDTDFSDKNTISLIEEYASFVERNSSLKHEYRMGIDTNNGRLVAIEFDLDPNRIVKVGNHVAFNNANSYSADPINYFLAFLQNKRDSAKTEEERDSWNRQINDTENKIYQRKSDEALAELKKSIKRTGHIDYVSKGGKVTNIFYYDGTGSGKHTKGPITMIPVLSPELNGFIRYLDSMNPAYLAYQKNPEQGYNILNDRFIKHRQTNPSNYNDKNKYIYSLTSLFTDSEIQKLFVKYVKDNHINGETYQVGESYSKDERFKTTKILWDALWMYRKFTYNPVFRGTIPTYDLANNRKNTSRYNGLNKPREAKKKKPIKESNTELLDSIYEALYPLDPRSYEAMNSLVYDEYLEALELHEIDVSAILNSKLPEDINLISEITSNIDWLISNKANQFNMDLSSYLEADDQSEEKDPVEEDDTPPNIDLGDEEIESDEPPTIDTDEPESTEEDPPSEDEPKEDPKEDTTNEAPNIIEPTSLPKAADAQESDKNGVNRKKLYIAFIEWAKSYNARNTFGSLFDKDVFDVTYPFVPHEMRYFYRLANPILCVLSGKLTFFQVSELRKLNADNPDMKDALIFAATENDYRAFSTRDKRVYLAVDKPDGSGIQFTRALADSFDLYIQNMIGKGDILHGDVDSSTDSGTDRGDHSDENGE